MESFVHPLDESRASVRVELAIARAEYELQRATQATASLYLAVYDTLAEARQSPEIYVPLSAARDADAAEFAERGAVLDLAIRMSIAEQTVRAYDHTVSTLLGRAPRVWSMFFEGEISVANVRTVTDIAATLPAELWDAFEDAAIKSAGLAPARFKSKMRGVRERLQPDAAKRHRVALEDRRTWIDRDVDSMSSIGILGSAVDCERANANVDRRARELAAELGETRTLAQLRADVALELLAGTPGTGVGVTVGLMIPILTMLGHSNEPALLQNYGPIDADTAREWAKNSRSFQRILTHPITGAVIGVDQPHYRPDTALDRLVRTRDQLCAIPGCGKSAIDCDLDHTVPWPAGPTSSANLKPLCRNHHRVKHKTRWKSEQDENGKTTWTSPTGFTRAADPPQL